MFLTRARLVGLALALSACSTKGDFERICNAEALSGVTSTNPTERTMLIIQWIEEHLRTEEGRRAMNALTSVATEQRGAVLKQAAHEAGYDGPCPFAETAGQGP